MVYFGDPMHAATLLDVPDHAMYRNFTSVEGELETLYATHGRGTGCRGDILSLAT